jgi:peroxiredoxin
MAQLRQGDEAPGFSLESVNSGTVSLGQLRGRRVLLVFGRYFGCPVCQREFDELEAFAAGHPGLAVVYVNQSSSESARSFLEGRKPGFPVIPAPRTDGRYPLYDLYGVGKLGLLMLVKLVGKGREARAAGKKHGAYEGIETQSPAQFLIGADGKIVWDNQGLFDTGKIEAQLGF